MILVCGGLYVQPGPRLFTIISFIISACLTLYQDSHMASLQTKIEGEISSSEVKWPGALV